MQAFQLWNSHFNYCSERGMIGHKFAEVFELHHRSHTTQLCRWLESAKYNYIFQLYKRPSTILYYGGHNYLD